MFKNPHTHIPKPLTHTHTHRYASPDQSGRYQPAPTPDSTICSRQTYRDNRCLLVAMATEPAIIHLWRLSSFSFASSHSLLFLFISLLSPLISRSSLPFFSRRHLVSSSAHNFFSSPLSFVSTYSSPCTPLLFVSIPLRLSSALLRSPPSPLRLFILSFYLFTFALWHASFLPPRFLILNFFFSFYSISFYSSSSLSSSPRLHSSSFAPLWSARLPSASCLLYILLSGPVFSHAFILLSPLLILLFLPSTPLLRSVYQQ